MKREERKNRIVIKRVDLGWTHEKRKEKDNI